MPASTTSRTHHWPPLFFGALVVESDPVIARRLKRILGLIAPERRVVLAPTREEAEAMLAALPFDLVFVDMQLCPIGDAAALIAGVRAKLPRTQVIALSDTHERGLAVSAFASGATGYLLSASEDAEIARTLRDLATGTVLDPRVAGHPLAMLAESLAPSSADFDAEGDLRTCRKPELEPRATVEGTRRGLPD